MMGRILLGLLIAAAGSTAAVAQITIQDVQPIVVREAKDNPGCYIYLKADGSRLLFQAKPIAARGNCPSDFQRGNVERFGEQSYRLRELRPGVFSKSAPALVMVGHWGLQFEVTPPGGRPFVVTLLDKAGG